MLIKLLGFSPASCPSEPELCADFSDEDLQSAQQKFREASTQRALRYLNMIQAIVVVAIVKAGFHCSESGFNREGTLGVATGLLTLLAGLVPFAVQRRHVWENGRVMQWSLTVPLMVCLICLACYSYHMSRLMEQAITGHQQGDFEYMNINLNLTGESCRFGTGTPQALFERFLHSLEVQGSQSPTCLGTAQSVNDLRKLVDWETIATTVTMTGLHLVLIVPHGLTLIPVAILFYAQIPLNLFACYKLFQSAGMPLEVQEIAKLWTGAMLTCLILFPLFVKVRQHTDEMQMQMLLLLEHQKRHLVKERVLRYEAEFKSEGAAGHQKPLEVDLGTCTSGYQSLQFSAMSAPSVLAWHPQVCAGGGRDCLPASLLVSVEGSPGLVELLSVKPEQKVLCRDSLTSSLKFVKVEENRAKDVPADDWIDIFMADGSRVTVTEDHPMRVSAPQSELFQQVLPASELVAGHHHLSVVKVIQTAITKVERVRTSQATTGRESLQTRCTLIVSQGERNSVLVADPSSTKTGFLAVGSADARTYQLGVKNSSLDAWETCEDSNEEAPLQRSNSAPALLESSQEKQGQKRWEKRIAFVKKKEHYQRWMAWWREHGRRDGDPLTPRYDQNKHRFEADYSSWMVALRSPPGLANLVSSAVANGEGEERDMVQL
eukprot:TRINITY_DN29332_c0_g1_i1.p1 TRINITY_DN29332_c0_g1~~TRINITY_DN29332_c0_g1_i1.p1  ORF type:complete len:676 (+),score=117.90 TRINITY_DN29332_c0_g1_i1:49-2028(+)